MCFEGKVVKGYFITKQKMNFLSLCSLLKINYINILFIDKYLFVTECVLKDLTMTYFQMYLYKRN